jgi:hypothetical protein
VLHLQLCLLLLLLLHQQLCLLLLLLLHQQLCLLLLLLLHQQLCLLLLLLQQRLRQGWQQQVPILFTELGCKQLLLLLLPG